MNRHIYLLILFFICATVNGQTITNPSLENWGVPNSCEINLAPDGWSGYSTGGVDPDEANFPLCPSTIPSAASNGNIYARCVAYPLGGEGMFQIISGFVIGNSYQVSFDYAGSNLFGGYDDIDWHLFIDDIDLNQTPVYHSTDSTWITHTYYFTATMTSHKIGVRLFLNSGSSGSGGIDNFMLSGTTSSEAIITAANISTYPNPVKDLFTVKVVGTNLPFEISLYNIDSREVFKQIFTNSVSVNTDHLAGGIYFYEIRNKNGLIKKGKIAKVM